MVRVMCAYTHHPPPRPQLWDYTGMLLPLSTNENRNASWWDTSFNLVLGSSVSILLQNKIYELDLGERIKFRLEGVMQILNIMSHI